MTTGAVIAQDAMFQAKILGQDQVPSSGDIQLVLRMLNRMLDSWSNVNTLIFVVDQETFVMSPNVGVYSTTLLSGGRPMSVDSLFVRLSDIDYPVDMVDNQTFNDITYKPVPAVPTMCYYDSDFPNANFNFYPLPYAAFTCFVDARQPLASTTITQSSDVQMPRGYEKAIIDGLAVYICKPFGKTATPDMLKDETDSKAIMKRANYVPLLMGTGLERDYSVNNDFPYRGF